MPRPRLRRCPVCEGEGAVEVECEPAWLDCGGSGRWVGRTKWRECERCDGWGELAICAQCEEPDEVLGEDGVCGECRKSNEEADREVRQ